eukprot:TRINITY_DN3002_c0_g1_i1.p1 TRINITY_DN3002_c0_g1~~TRINITY_DN3002_c0_g1_i1.p1  ORF type:complete len:483 (+),score=143.23 TRINITY_DN3002_c0_g1_i1:44-1492(+)
MSGNIKSGDWMSVFLGGSDAGQARSTSSRSNRDNSLASPTSSRRQYNDIRSYTTSSILRSSSTTSFLPYTPQCTYYNPITGLNGGSRHNTTALSSGSHRPFRSRFLRSTKADYYGLNDEPQSPSTNKSSTERSTIECPSRKDPKLHGGVLNNGSVLLRMNSRAESSDEDSEDEEASSKGDSLENVQEEEEEEPEDPLDIEERELIQKLSDKEKLSYSEECDLRKRLFDIKTIKFKKNQDANENGVSQKFQKIANEISDSNSKAKEEEKKILIKRLGSSNVKEVEQKDLQVRLQEILRDQKTEIESSIKNIESHYEHILEETTTELTEIESSIRGKNQLVEKLQEEILSMNVRKEVLNEEIESLHNSHGSSIKKFEDQVSSIDADISRYSVLVPIARKEEDSKRTHLNNEELQEIEGELECPVCMDISRPPIYQCEEGHIICSTCKPLLTNCPHCASKYSEPAIRCRFAEKLSLRYFSLAEDN